MKRKYNLIYRALVEDGKHDIIGYIAYAIYKSDKIAFVEKYKREHNGSEPSEHDLDQFHKISSMEANLERLKMQAIEVVSRTMMMQVDKAREEIEQEAKANILRTLNEIVEPLKPKPFIDAIADNVVISIISSIVLMFAFAILFSYLSFRDNGISFRIGTNKDGITIRTP